MKTKSSLLLAGLLASAAVGFANNSDRNIVTASQLSPAARRTLDAVTDQGPVKEIVRKTEDGRVIYDVEFEKKNAINPRLRIAEDGAVVKSSASVVSPVVTGVGEATLPPDFVTAGTPQKLTLAKEETPAAVLTTINRLASGREVADIDKETANGRTVYEVEYKQKGRNEHVFVAEDGAVVSDADRPSHSVTRNVKSWFKDTKLEDTPSAVQATIQREASGREVVDIDREGKQEAPEYQVKIRESEHRNFKLRVAADGTILSDSRTGSSAK